mgnify:FL=1
MEVIQRAWKFVTRKRLKSVIMLVILLLMSSVILSGLAIKNATDQAANEIGKKVQSAFVLENNARYNMGTPRGAGTVKNKDIEQIAKLDGVTGCVRRMDALVDLKNAKQARLPGGVKDYDAKKEKDYGEAVNFMGVNNSAQELKFRTETFKLVAGRHIKEDDKFKVLVHEDFAKLNNLKLGSKIKVQANPHDPDNLQKSHESAEVEIVGIFSGKNSRKAAVRSELFENIFYTDLATTRKVNKVNSDNEIYQNVTFFAKDVNTMGRVLEQAKKLPIDWKMYQLTKSEQELAGITSTLGGIYGLVFGVMMFGVILGVGVLSLVLFLWINERKKEVGVLLASGVSKFKIILQFAAEILMIFVISFGCSYFISKAVSQNVGNDLVTQASKNTTKEINKSLNGSFGADADSSVTTKTIDHIDVEVKPELLIGTFGFAMVVITIAILIGTSPILKSKPKQLLMEVE